MVAWQGSLVAVLLVLAIPLVAVVFYALLWLSLHLVIWLCWNASGRDVLFVYSESPVWHAYIEATGWASEAAGQWCPVLLFRWQGRTGLPRPGLIGAEKLPNRAVRRTLWLPHPASTSRVRSDFDEFPVIPGRLHFCIAHQRRESPAIVKPATTVFGV